MKLKVLFKYLISFILLFTISSCVTTPTLTLDNGIRVFLYNRTVQFKVIMDVVLDNPTEVHKNAKMLCRVYKDGRRSLKDTKIWIVKVPAKSHKIFRAKINKSYVTFVYNCYFIPLNDALYVEYKKL